jgi:hypothetical protein
MQVVVQRGTPQRSDFYFTANRRKDEIYIRTNKMPVSSAFPVNALNPDLAAATNDTQSLLGGAVAFTRESCKTDRAIVVSHWFGERVPSVGGENAITK